MSDDRFPRTILSQVPWSGRIMAVHVDQLELPNGAVVEREAIRHPRIAAVVALDEHEQVLLVREYRHPAGETFLQIPSGIREPGEEAAACARRELIEETGYDARCLEHLLGFYPSPGASNEFADLFLGTELVASRFWCKSSWAQVPGLMLRGGCDGLVDRSVSGVGARWRAE